MVIKLVIVVMFVHSFSIQIKKVCILIENKDSNGDGIGDACCDDKLRAWWKFDETIGTYARDWSGFGTHLKIQGGKWLSSKMHMLKSQMDDILEPFL